MRSYIFSSFLLLAITLTASYEVAFAQDFLTQENVTVDSARSAPTNFRQAAEPEEGPEEKPVIDITEGEDEDKLHPFLRNTKLKLNARTYYRNATNLVLEERTAWALGGSLEYQSGKVFDALSIGAGLFTSQPLYAPADKGNTGLLTPDQQQITVLGTAFVDLDLESHEVKLGRNRFNLPYINQNDSRMIPVTHEALGGSGTVPWMLDDKLTYIWGYFSKVKERDADEFEYMSEAAGDDGGKRGTFSGGLFYEYAEGTDVGVINHFTKDAVNLFYAEAHIGAEFSYLADTKWSVQFTDQRAVGDGLTGDKDFRAQMLGAKGLFSFKKVLITVAATKNSKNGDLISPFGGYPGYNNMMTNSYERAGEWALRFSLHYDFKNIGVPGVSSFLNLVKGGGAVVPGTDIHRVDRDELDITFDYKPTSGWLNDLWIRARYAYVITEDKQDGQDVRIILNYPINLL